MINKRLYKKNSFSEVIIDHISNNIMEYIVMIIIFIIGIILGKMYINKTDLNQKQEISSYINDFIEVILILINYLQHQYIKTY